jgi:sirohydrochlorin ferrochelatase
VPPGNTRRPEKAAVIFFAHGSSVESANQAVREVSRAAAGKAGFDLWSAAFLEGGQPNLAAAVEKLAAAGARRVIVVPYFLTLGLHLQRDFPCLIAEVAAAYKDIDIVCGDPLDGHPGLVEILAERARQAYER